MSLNFVNTTFFYQEVTLQMWSIDFEQYTGFEDCVHKGRGNRFIDPHEFKFYPLLDSELGFCELPFEFDIEAQYMDFYKLKYSSRSIWI